MVDRDRVTSPETTQIILRKHRSFSTHAQRRPCVAGGEAQLQVRRNAIKGSITSKSVPTSKKTVPVGTGTSGRCGSLLGAERTAHGTRLGRTERWSSGGTG
jgi:hypothetical protein